MTELRITTKQFFSKQGEIKLLHPVISKSILHESPIILDMKRDAIHIYTEKKIQNPSNFLISGASIDSNNCSYCTNSIKQLLLLPFIFSIKSMQLPYGQLTFIGNEANSIASFFCKNYISAVLRHCSFRIEKSSANEYVSITRHFNREYFLSLNRLLACEELKNRDAKESTNIITLNIFLGSNYFKNSILNGSLDEYTNSI